MKMACWVFNFLNKFRLSSGRHSKLRHFRFVNKLSRCYSIYVDKDWSINDVVDHLVNPDTKNVVVMAGAGISTPSGIPDFRSPGTGLYDNLKQYNLPYAEAIFELDYFRANPKPFFALAKELYPGNYKPNLVHYFCSLLHHKRKLLRMYTQNIDGLERMAGIPADKLVEAHGTFTTAKCMDCRKIYQGSAIRQKIINGEIPLCETENCKGIIKPDIVFFGEQLPERFFLHNIDMEEADTLIVMGTSLEVQPFASIAMMVDDIPRILINKELVRSFVTSDSQSDVLLLGDVAENVSKLVNMLKWTKELDELMSKST